MQNRVPTGHEWVFPLLLYGLWPCFAWMHQLHVTLCCTLGRTSKIVQKDHAAEKSLSPHSKNQHPLKWQRMKQKHEFLEQLCMDNTSTLLTLHERLLPFFWCCETHPRIWVNKEINSLSQFFFLLCRSTKKQQQVPHIVWNCSLHGHFVGFWRKWMACIWLTVFWWVAQKSFLINLSLFMLPVN